jgi:hypothetical protein
MISGHWYSGAGEADVNTAFLAQTGARVGDICTLTSGSRHLTVRIAGEVFDPSGGRPAIIASTVTLAAVPAGIVLHRYVLPAMGHAAQTDVPPSVLNVYHPAELVLLALSGLVIAVARAVLPSGLGGQDPHRVRAE